MFWIRRLDKTPPPAPDAATSPDPAPAPPPSPPDAPPSAALPATPPLHRHRAAPQTGGRFRRAAPALEFLGAVTAAGLADEATCRRDGTGDWWLEVPTQPEQAAELVWAAGGRPYRSSAAGWLPLSVRPGAGLAGVSPLAAAAWPELELAELLARVTLAPAPREPLSAVTLITPGVFAPWVLERTAALGLEVSLRPAQRRPLAGPGGPAAVLRLDLRSPRRPIPNSLLRALADLPATTLARGGSGESLLIDIGRRAPLPTPFLNALVPPGETWVLGAPDLGHTRLRLTGEPVPAAGLVTAPRLVPRELGPAAPARLPPPPIRILASRRGPTQVDALLLDDQELHWLQRYLQGRPAAELSFILPGDGRHLLTAPGGLPEEIPFGVPLARIGPGGLYLELGRVLHPPLPPAARREAFQLQEGALVVVTGGGTPCALRFDRAGLRPAWSLWLGAAPELRDSRPPGHRAGLERLADRLAGALGPPPPAIPELAPAAPGLEPQDLRLQALRAELAGQYQEAAQLLETIGDYARAARLYEAAAE